MLAFTPWVLNCANSCYYLGILLLEFFLHATKPYVNHHILHLYLIPNDSV